MADLAMLLISTILLGTSVLGLLGMWLESQEEEKIWKEWEDKNLS